jgi:molecular chaperone IbpA
MDLDPFRRSSIGFDRMLNLLDDTYRLEGTDHPPYDIAQTGENAFRIYLAVPGYSPADIDVVAHQNVLTVTGKARSKTDEQYMYRTIPSDGFERRFHLADYVTVKTAGVENGLLKIELAREVPEALKPRRIEIRTGE